MPRLHRLSAGRRSRHRSRRESSGCPDLSRPASLRKVAPDRSMLPLPPMPVASGDSRLVFPCVHCQGTVAAPVALAGSLVSCPLCGGIMAAPVSSQPPAAFAGPPLAPDTAPHPPDSSPPELPPVPPSQPSRFPEPPPAPARIAIQPRANCQPPGLSGFTLSSTPAKPPIHSPFATIYTGERTRPVRPASDRSLHPETGIDMKHMDRRESFAFLRLVAAFLVVMALCAAAVWLLRAHLSF